MVRAQERMRGLPRCRRRGDKSARDKRQRRSLDATSFPVPSPAIAGEG
jgi:hypothetical protein